MKLNILFLLCISSLMSINLEAPRRGSDRESRRNLDIKKAALGGLAIPNNPVFAPKSK